MRVIGLTGGVGSGKSRVLNILKEEYGAYVLVADTIAHQLMEPSMEGYQSVVAALGDQILNQEGIIDKSALSKLIFNDEKVRLTVNSIIHPLVWNYIEREIITSQAELIVVEFAIMDRERNKSYDEMWYVYTTRENRIRRLYENRGYTRERTEQIMASQSSEEEFRSACDRVIDNNGTIEELRAQLEAILGSRGQ